MQNKQGIYCINNARWVSFKPKYSRFESIQQHICLKELEKVGKWDFSSNHKNTFIYSFQEGAGELFRTALPAPIVITFPRLTVSAAAHRKVFHAVSFVYPHLRV